MSKKILLISSVLVLLAAGCSQKTAVQTDSQINTAPTPQPAEQQMSIKDLLLAGKAQKCAVDTSTPNSQSQGTVYIASGKMRGDFTSEVNGKTTTTHMINDGTTVYTWIDGSNMALKMPASATQQGTGSGQATATKAAVIDPDVKHNYNCSSWTVDGNLLTPPTNINFTDQSKMNLQIPVVPKTGSMSAGASASACLACNNAGAGKAQCLVALGCK